MMEQQGFFFDKSRCTGCHTCAMACKSSHQLPPGPLKYLKIYQYEEGAFPNLRLHLQWIPCYHCEKPSCVEACPAGAMHKEEKYGAVLIDPDKCNGCRLCYKACPYGAPVFESDARGTVAQKCDMCFDRQNQGELPVCVLSCPIRALDFGPLAKLEQTYGKSRDLPDLPSSQLTQPAVVFKPSTEKRRLVPYNAERAVELFMKRDPLPQVFSSPSDITDIPEGLVCRSKLVLKHACSEELMKFTRDDEG